jgi:O-antigen/teichoic acid export membrane protein
LDYRLVTIALTKKPHFPTTVRAAGLQLLSTRIVMRVVAIVMGVLLTRGLGPQGKGTYLLLTVIVAFVMQLTYGDAAATAWQWGRSGLPENKVFAACVLVGGTITLLATLIIATLAVLQHNAVLWSVVAVLPFAVLAQLCAGFFLTKQRILILNIQDGISRVAVPAAAAVVVIISPHDLRGVLIVWVAAQWALGLFSLLALLRTVNVWPFVVEKAVVLSHARFAFQACGQQVLAYLNSRIDIIVVSFALGAAALGVYSVAIAGNEILWMFTRAMGVAAFGRITTGGSKESAALAARCIRHGMMIAVVGAVIAFFLAPLIPWIFGAGFAQAVGALRIVLPGAVVWCSMDILTVFFSTQLGRPALALAVQGLSASICAAITLTLASRIGIAAGALGSSLGYLVGGSLAILLFSRATGISVRDVVVPKREDILLYVSSTRKLIASATGAAH